MRCFGFQVDIQPVATNDGAIEVQSTHVGAANRSLAMPPPPCLIGRQRLTGYRGTRVQRRT